MRGQSVVRYQEKKGFLVSVGAPVLLTASQDVVLAR